VVVFPPNTVRFDDDIVTNSRNAIESLVRVGERIGKRRA
jgi:phosphatidylserine decarboxylase